MSQPVPTAGEFSKQPARPLPMSDEVMLQNVRVASPCSANWDAMPGGERVRSCAQCNHKVYNLSEMPAADAAQLLRASEGRVCVRFYRRADGTVMTKDCPVGLRALRQRAARAATLAFSTLFISMGGLSLATRTRSEQPRFLRWALNTVSPQPEPPLMPAMGEMLADPQPEIRMGEIVREPEVIMGKMPVASEPEPEAIMGAVPAYRDPQSLSPGNSFDDAVPGYGGVSPAPGCIAPRVSPAPVAPEEIKPFLRGNIITPSEFRDDPFVKADTAKK